jgi:hypothetical protein
MCWSESASIGATAIGAVATVYAAKKDIPKERTFALGFFTLMELLQAVSYIWIGQCDVHANALLTYLSYIHIAFQIPVANAFMLSYISPKARKKWLKPVMIMSFIATFFMLLKVVIPFIWEAPKEWMCKTGDILCGPKACSYMGNWHLAWRLPLLGIDPFNLVYTGLVFILPVFYGNWRISLFHFIVGPFLAFLLTTDRNESPAIWCLFSIAILCAIFFTPLKKWFETPMRES